MLTTRSEQQLAASRDPRRDFKREMERGELDVCGGRLTRRITIPKGRFLPKNFNFDRMNPPEHFLVERIAFYFSNSSMLQDVWSIVEGVPWHLQIHCKYYDQGLMLGMQSTGLLGPPFRVCDYCGGVYVVSTDHQNCPTCGANKFHLLLSSEEAGSGSEVAGAAFLYDLPIPHILLSQMQFDVWLGQAWLGQRELSEHVWMLELQQDVTIWCIIAGLHARGRN